MNYLTLFLLISGLFLSTNADKPSKVNFENMTEVDSEFVEFLNHFEKTNLPYEMTIDEIDKIKESEFEYDHEKNDLLLRLTSGEDYESLKFSRMGPPIITPLKRFNPTEKTIAVSYVVKTRYSKMFPVIMMAVYNLKGKLLSIKENKFGKFHKTEQNHVISQNDQNKTESFLITNNGLAQITSYEISWKKDPKEFGYFDNEIKSKKLMGQETFRFQDDGQFVSLGKISPEDIAVQMP